MVGALPVGADGGVDWVRALESHLLTPRLERAPRATAGAPLTLETIIEAAPNEPGQPPFALDTELTPSVAPAFAGGTFYKVRFPHGTHTAWLACSSCHPGIQSAKTNMQGILEGGYCGQCHGRVAFAPQLSCGRCHVNLAVPAPEAVDAEVAAAAAAPVEAAKDVIARGAAVYQQLCAVCHGESGNGAGPLSPPLDPKPRDFTAGKFKFRTTLPSSIPADTDIFRIITAGIPGTSMPSFAALSREDRWALTHYVKTFSDRFRTAKPEPVPMAPPPEPTQAVLEMGLDLYKQAGCNSCHGDTGGGDGPSAPTLKDDWGNALRPFNFASGRPMKGGSGPGAVYRTIMTGLQGTPMPGFGDALEPAQAWALTLYVLTLFDKDKQPFAVKGDIAFVRAEALRNAPEVTSHAPAVFPHWFHRVRVTCASCHPALFTMRAGSNAISMDALRSGRFCAACHNGKVAWEIGFTTCIRCHVTPEPKSQ